MSLHLDERTGRILKAVRECQPGGAPVYLVGGAVRDLVLGKIPKDLDFVVQDNSMSLAAAARRKLGGVGFTLDDERQTARVILRQGKTDELVLDFVRFSGANLLEDLGARDFTINAMALELDHPEIVIDPFRGQEDLQERVLRAASAQSLGSDPLRVLRGIRMIQAYKLNVNPETDILMRVATKGVTRISGERIRDELFKILEIPGKRHSLELLDHYDLIETLWPEISPLKTIGAHAPHVHPLWIHTLRVVECLEEYLASAHEGTDSTGLSKAVPQLSALLEKFSPDIKDHFNRPIQGGRKRRELFFLAALLHDIGKPITRSVDIDGRSHFYGHDSAGLPLVQKVGERLMLGREECSYLSTMVGQHMRVHLLANQKPPVTDRAIYRFFQAVDDCGVDLALLSLADLAATYEDTLPGDKLAQEIDIVNTILDAWFCRREHVVKPGLFIDGNELQKELGLRPGKLLGVILSELREAQAAGMVHSRESALEFAKQLVKKLSAGDL